MSWGSRPYGQPMPRALRLRVLVEEPRCRGCGAPATEVDHIEPRYRRPDLFLVRTNLQALCRRCHARKTGARDSKPAGRRLREPEPHPGEVRGGGSNLCGGASQPLAGLPVRESVRVSGVRR